MTDQKQKLSVNFIFNIANKVVALILPLITTPYLTRVLGSNEIGIFNYANTVASYFVSFAMMGLALYGSKQIASNIYDENEVNRQFSILFSIQVINTILCSIAYFVYALFLCKDNRLIAAIQLGYVLSAFADITWYFSGKEYFKSLAIRNICVSTISTICIFSFVKTSDDIVLYTIIKTASVLVSQLVLLLSSIREIKLVPIKRRDLLEAYPKLLVLFIPVLAESVFHNIDRVMLGVMSSYSAVGIYYTSRMITDVPQTVVSSINTIMYPRVTSLISSGDSKKANAYWAASFEVINALCIAICFGLVAICDRFVNIYLGPDYHQCADCIPLLVPYVFLAAWNLTIRYQYLLPNSKEKTYASAVIAGITCNLVLNYALIPSYGVKGAIFATVISEFVIAIIQTLVIISKINLFKMLLHTFIYSLIGASMSSVIGLLDMTLGINSIIKLLIEIGVGVVVFSVLLIVYWKCINKKIWKSVVSLLKN